MLGKASAAFLADMCIKCKTHPDKKKQKAVFL